MAPFTLAAKCWDQMSAISTAFLSASSSSFRTEASALVSPPLPPACGGDLARPAINQHHWSQKRHSSRSVMYTVYLNAVETVLTAPDLLSGKFQTRFFQIILLKFINLITNTVAKVQVHTYRLIYFWTPLSTFAMFRASLVSSGGQQGRT